MELTKSPDFWQFAGFKLRRVGAAVIDLVAALTVMRIAQRAMVGLSLLPLLVFLYIPIAEALFGQTLGKLIFDLTVVDKNGAKPGMHRALFRLMCALVECYLMPLIGLWLITTNPYGKRAGDMAAGTFVVSKKRLIALNRAPSSRPSAAG